MIWLLGTMLSAYPPTQAGQGESVFKCHRRAKW